MFGLPCLWMRIVDVVRINKSFYCTNVVQPVPVEARPLLFLSEWNLQSNKSIDFGTTLSFIQVTLLITNLEIAPCQPFRGKCPTWWRLRPNGCIWPLTTAAKCLQDYIDATVKGIDAYRISPGREEAACRREWRSYLSNKLSRYRIHNWLNSYWIQ